MHVEEPGPILAIYLLHVIIEKDSRIVRFGSGTGPGSAVDPMIRKLSLQ